MPWGAKQTARNGVGSSPGMKISAVYGMLSKSIESIPSGIDHHDVLDAVSPPAVYPIKSCRGSKLSSCNYSPTGLKYDRHWMIADAKSHRFLTARTIPRMVLISPSLDLDEFTLTVQTPSDPPSKFTFPIGLPPGIDETSDTYFTDFSIWKSPRTDGFIVGPPELQAALSSFLGHDVVLVKKGSTWREAGPAGYVDSLKLRLDYDPDHADQANTFGESQTPFSRTDWADGFPFLLATESSLKEVRNMIKQSGPDLSDWDPVKWGGSDESGGQALEMIRFRPNFVIDGAQGWEEESWSELEIIPERSEEREQPIPGDRIYVVSRCARCQLPNVDPSTGERDPVVPYKVIDLYRRSNPKHPRLPCFGMNAVPRTSSGRISVGDWVKVVGRYETIEPGTGRWVRPEDNLDL